MFAQLVVKLSAPILARQTALGVFLIHAQALRELAAHLVNLATLVHGLANGLSEPDTQAVIHLAGCGKRVGFLRGKVGQDDVRELGRRRHEHVVAQDELAQRFVTQHFGGEVDVAVLVGRHVVAVVHEHLDAALQAIAALNAVLFGRQRRTVFDGLDPQEVRELLGDGVVARRQRGQRETRVALVRAGVRARLAHLANQLRKQHDGTRRIVAVGMALHAPTLCHEQRLSLADFLCKLLDARFGNTGNLGCPSRGLLDLVVTRAHNVSVIRGILRRALWQRILGVAHAIFLQEVVVGELELLELVRDACHKRGIGAGTDGNPFRALVDGHVVAARVDHDDAHALLLDGDVQVVACAIATHARVHHGIAEQHDELAFLQRLERAAAPAIPVGEGVCAEVQRTIRIVAVARDLAAQQIE